MRAHLIQRAASAIVERGIYHRTHARMAVNVRRAIEKEQGQCSRRQLRLAAEYATDVFGHRRYAPWLQVYTALRGNFVEGWIPDNYYGWEVVPRVNGVVGEVSGTKGLSPRMFPGAPFPRQAFVVGGRLFNPQGAGVSVGSYFEDCELLIFKPDSSSRGRGIRILKPVEILGDKLDGLPQGVLQEYVHQHEILRELGGGAVATVRLTTVRPPCGDVSVRAAYLRIPRCGDEFVRFESQIRVGLAVHDGALDVKGYSSSWESMSAHPDSGVQFLGLSCPSYEECVSVARSLHRSLPHVQCIGWDFAVDQVGSPVLLEWNAQHNDIKFTEATQGPGFRDLGWEQLWRGRPRPCLRWRIS